MFQLARRGTDRYFDEAERRMLRAHFDEHWWVPLPGLLGSDLLAEVQSRVARAPFLEHRHEGVVPPSVDFVMGPDPVHGLVELLVNDPEMFRQIEEITGCDPIGHFRGFVYRLVPEQGHHNWHNDLIKDRMIAMSINLGPGTYEGGLLELRRRGEPSPFAAVPNVVPGDAVAFALDPSIEHRATSVTSGVKTAFAGWFCRGARYTDILRGLSAS